MSAVARWPERILVDAIEGMAPSSVHIEADEEGRARVVRLELAPRTERGDAREADSIAEAVESAADARANRVERDLRRQVSDLHASLEGTREHYRIRRAEHEVAIAKLEDELAEARADRDAAREHAARACAAEARMALAISTVDQLLTSRGEDLAQIIATARKHLERGES